jgi:hypothetical protein
MYGTVLYVDGRSLESAADSGALPRHSIGYSSFAALVAPTLSGYNPFRLLACNIISSSQLDVKVVRSFPVTGTCPLALFPEFADLKCVTLTSSPFGMRNQFIDNPLCPGRRLGMSTNVFH